MVVSACLVGDSVRCASMGRLVRVAWRKLRDAEALVVMRFPGHFLEAFEGGRRSGPEMVYLGGRQLAVVIASRVIRALFVRFVTVAAMTGRKRRHVGMKPRPMISTSGPDNLCR